MAVVGVSGSWCWRWWWCRTVAGGWRGHTAAVASGNVSGGHSGTLTTLDLYNLWIVQTADLCRVQVMTLMMLRLPLSVSPCPSPRSCPAADNNTLYTLHSTLVCSVTTRHNTPPLWCWRSAAAQGQASTGQQCEDRQRIHNLTVIGDGILSTRMHPPTPQTGNTGMVHNNIGY